MSDKFEQISLKPGFMKHNGGVLFRNISDTEYEFKSTINENHLNAAGITHGGYLSALVDAGAGTAAHRSADNAPCVTISLDLKFIGASKKGDEVTIFLAADGTHLLNIKNEGEVVEIRGEFLPLVRLHEKFMVDCDYKSPADAVVLVIHQGERKQCLMVDEIVDQRPVVIKNLDENFVQVPGMSGATIMGDGKVSFILDVATVMN